MPSGQDRRNNGNDSPAAGGARPLSLDAREIEELISLAGGDRLHAAPPRRARKSARIPMRGMRTCAKVQHPGGGANSWQVCLIDLSDGGLGMIYPGFLHIGTRLVVTLPRPGAEPISVPGKVTWCRFLRKQFHAVGVAWDKPIEARDFVETAAWLESVSTGDAASASRLGGRLIHLCANPIEHQLLKMHTSETELRVVWARDTGPLLDAIRTAPADILVLDVDSMGPDPAQLIRTVRFEQFLGPALLAASQAHPDAEKLLIDDKVQQVLKPLTQESLINSIRRLMHHTDNPMSGTAPIYSELGMMPDKWRWISDYLESCRAMSGSLMAVVASGDRRRAIDICQSLSVTGAGYGFPILSQVASSAIEALEQADAGADPGPRVRSLVFLINRLKVAQAA